MIFVYLLLSAAIVGIDQWVKFWTVSNFELGESQSVIPSILSLTHIRNTGAAWSLLEGKMWFFAIVTTIAVIVVLYLLIKNLKGSKWFTIGLSLVLAGALGNFIDRMRLGYVVDMFQTDFMNFPIFNVADMSLVIGVACIFIYIILDEREKGN
ncbi:signal peptidase II [Enterococcus sp. JM4C]|uniref:signal peptidase II n=1 Tax=Candidatus Enterococcus huntleyi TaxID=1857217 RepID=UPI00137A45E2|nr:signal peptidase II [Enterococcus sp. JM4C]KAF1296103.1 signal peptidase II [Enterococcus sp. JM4C]